MRILVQPFGNVPQKLIQNISSNLPHHFPGSEVIQGDSVWDLPEDAFNHRRNQFLARAILEDLSAWGDEHHYGRVLGICASDLYAVGFNFIVGEAEYPGKAAIISLRRLGGARKDEDDRALKEAIHELGHTFGLKHCRNPSCVMRFSNTLQDTDLKGFEFCERCFAKLNNPTEKPLTGAR